MDANVQANYNMDSDAASEAASSAAKSLDEKSSVASDVPLIPERSWINTHAWIQGLTMMLLVRACLASIIWNVDTHLMGVGAVLLLTRSLGPWAWL